MIGDSDIDIFINTTDFASLHAIGGASGVPCIVGEKTSGFSQIDGIWVDMFDVTVAKSAIALPEKYGKVSFDSVSYTVENIRDDWLIVVLTLSGARPGTMVVK